MADPKRAASVAKFFKTGKGDYGEGDISGGADTITVTLTGSATLELLPYDYSGLDPSSPLDASATPATGTGTSGTSGTVTTTNADDLLFAFFHSDNSVNDTAGTGFTGRTPPIDNTPLGEDENVTSTGTYSATMSFSGTADYVAFLAAFKAAPGGGGGGGGTVANPSISPVGGAYSSPQTITVSDSTSGATICVRTDGGTPTANTPGTCDSPATAYSPGAQFPLTIPSGGATVKALGTLTGYTNSNMVTNTYSLAGAAATPTFSPGTGTYSGTQTVTISTTSSGAVICWTTTGTPATNGASGCTTGTLYGGPVTVSASETLYAVAGGAGYSDSTPSSAAYTIGPTGPQVYYYIQDSLGTTRMMTDSSGTVCYDADFYPFGGERNYIDNCDQHYKFTGYERDSESNLDNARARYYGFSLGRFMSPDPDNTGADPTAPQSWNMYSYVLDSPLTSIDPLGLDCVYLDDLGLAVEQVDHNSNSDECEHHGGTWLDGYVDPNNVVTDLDSNWVGEFGSNNQISQAGCLGTADQCSADTLANFLAPSTTVYVSGSDTPDTPLDSFQTGALGGAGYLLRGVYTAVACASSAVAPFLPAPDPDDIQGTMVGQGLDAGSKAADFSAASAERKAGRMLREARASGAELPGGRTLARVAKLENQAAATAKAAKVLDGAGYVLAAHSSYENIKQNCVPHS